VAELVQDGQHVGRRPMMTKWAACRSGPWTPVSTSTLANMLSPPRMMLADASVIGMRSGPMSIVIVASVEG
jgi:hypothetical protein